MAIDSKEIFFYGKNEHHFLPFYTKNGFVEFDQHVFVLGDEAQTDIMMKLALK